jgi:hypothetical protein
MKIKLQEFLSKLEQLGESYDLFRYDEPEVLYIEIKGRLGYRFKNDEFCGGYYRPLDPDRPKADWQIEWKEWWSFLI